MAGYPPRVSFNAPQLDHSSGTGAPRLCLNFNKNAVDTNRLVIETSKMETKRIQRLRRWMLLNFNLHELKPKTLMKLEDEPLAGSGLFMNAFWSLAGDSRARGPKWRDGAPNAPRPNYEAGRVTCNPTQPQRCDYARGGRRLLENNSSPRQWVELALLALPRSREGEIPLAHLMGEGLGAAPGVEFRSFFLPRLLSLSAGIRAASGIVTDTRSLGAPSFPYSSFLPCSIPLRVNRIFLPSINPQLSIKLCGYWAFRGTAPKPSAATELKPPANLF